LWPSRRAWITRDHARVVEHEQIAFAKQRWQLAEHPVLEVAVLPVEHEQPGRVALRQGLLSYLRFGEFEVEVFEPHQ
jgi:hypothetical protein